MKSTRRAHQSMIVSTLLVATSFPVVAAIAGELPSIVLTLARTIHEARAHREQFFR